jgi:hypothetical protein
MKLDCILTGIGVWLLSDAIYSLLLYLTAENYNGKRQSWARDHSIRIVRAILAVAIVAIGWGLE